MDKNELLQAMRTARRALEDTLAHVDEADLDLPALHGGWSVKDTIAHIGFWENRAAYIYETLQKGETPTYGIEATSVDGVNQAAYDEYHPLPAAEVRQMEQAAYRRLLALVEQAPEEALFSHTYFSWTDGQPFADWVAGNSFDHYSEHIESLRAFLADRSGE